MRVLRERSREIRLIVFTCLCLIALLFFIKRFNPNTRQQEGAKASGQRLGEGLPEEGFAQNPVGDHVPGDPENGIRDLKKLGEYIQIYRSRHGGKYPANILDLDTDYTENFKAYGFKDAWDTLSLFRNPDSKYADDLALRHNPKRVVPYIVQGKRLDGSPVGGPKKSGERDVIATTDIYYHENIVNRNLPAKDSAKPIGFYLVLYDDGAVEKVSWKDVRLVQQGNNTKPPIMYHFGFPDQPGVPKDAPPLKSRFGDMKGI